MLTIGISSTLTGKNKRFDLCNLENTDFYIIQVALEKLSNDIKSNPTEDKIVFLSRVSEMELLMAAFMHTPLFNSNHVQGE